MADNVYTPRRTAWDCKWNGNSVGTVYEVDPDLSYELDPITRASTGKVILGYWLTKLMGMVKIQFADINLVFEQTMFPWWSSGSVPLVPVAPQVNIYQYAQELILHPRDQGATTTEDLHLIKTVPGKPMNIKRQNEKDDLWQMEFVIFPDVSRLQTNNQLVYGYIGNVAI